MLNRRVWAIVIMLSLCACCLAPVQAETEYPPRPEGAVADLAGVLGESAVKDIGTLSGRLTEAVSGSVYVLTRHFLGGVDAQQYADKVFEVWGLKENDALLLMVIGEESFALSLGSGMKAKLSAEERTGLLATHFRTPFLNRQYDEAAADLAVSLSQAMAKAQGKTVDVTGLFGQSAISAQATPKPQSASDFWSNMFARDDYDATENSNDQIWQSWQSERRSEETRINWRSVIIWALVIYFLFFRKKKRQPRRR